MIWLLLYGLACVAVGWTGHQLWTLYVVGDADPTGELDLPPDPRRWAG